VANSFGEFKLSGLITANAQCYVSTQHQPCLYSNVGKHHPNIWLRILAVLPFPLWQLTPGNGWLSSLTLQ
jgi:hypothetical protein